MTTDFNRIPAWQSSDLSDFSCSPSLRSVSAGRSHSLDFAYIQFSRFLSVTNQKKMRYKWSSLISFLWMFIVWVSKFKHVKKVLSHWLQKKLFVSVSFICLPKWTMMVNINPYLGQRNGFRSMWILLWLVRTQDWNRSRCKWSSQKARVRCESSSKY